jgi:hypothetical protein
MPKYYVIPVDADGFAYLGVKSLQSPYDGKSWWCGGAPNVFGGNSDGHTLKATLKAEALQESHGKIQIDLKDVEVGDKSAFQIVHESEESGGMAFYAVRGNFIYNPDAKPPPGFLGSKPYKETTGAILRVNLKELDIGSTGKDLLSACVVQTKNVVPPKGGEEFLSSEAVKAIAEAASKVQGGTL